VDKVGLQKCKADQGTVLLQSSNSHLLDWCHSFLCEINIGLYYQPDFFFVLRRALEQLVAFLVGVNH